MAPTTLPLRVSRGIVFCAAFLAAFAALLALGAVGPNETGLPLTVVERVLAGTSALMAAAGVPLLWRRRQGHVEVGGDAVRLRAFGSREQVVPWTAIGRVVARPTTVPPRREVQRFGTQLGKPAVLIELTEPVEIPLLKPRSEPVTTMFIAISPEDVDAMAAALSHRPAQPTAVPEPPPAKARSAPRQLVQALVLFAAFALFNVGMRFGLDAGWAILTGHQPHPELRAEANERKAEQTEGHSVLPPLPQVAGATLYRGVAADGSEAYAWRSGDRLRLRVDVAPYDCVGPGESWRQWWRATPRDGIRTAADGRFTAAPRRTTRPIPSTGGIDVLTTSAKGRVDPAGGAITVSFTRSDSYRSASGNRVCARHVRAVLRPAA